MEQEDILGQETHYLQQADKGLRFANLLIDTVIYYILVLSAGLLLGLVMYSTDPVMADEMFMQEEDTPLFTFITYVIGFSVMFLYYFICEATSQRTLGKLITGTIVVTHSGEKPSSREIAIRSFSRLVPFEAFSFLGDAGWHDKWSDTYVVKKKDLRIEV